MRQRHLPSVCVVAISLLIHFTATPLQPDRSHLRSCALRTPVIAEQPRSR